MAISYGVKQLNKKQMKKLFLVCIVSTFIGTMQFLHNNEVEHSSSLLKENVDALTNGEGSPCEHNTNGYKNWKLSGGLFGKKKEFYDCCTILREGYSPSGNCNVIY